MITGLRYEQHTCEKVSYLKYQRHHYKRSTRARKRKLVSKSFKKNLIKERNSIKRQIFKKVTGYVSINLNNTASARE
jgi:hypothetical protein